VQHPDQRTSHNLPPRPSQTYLLSGRNPRSNLHSLDPSVTTNHPPGNCRALAAGQLDNSWLSPLARSAIAGLWPPVNSTTRELLALAVRPLALDADDALSAARGPDPPRLLWGCHSPARTHHPGRFGLPPSASAAELATRSASACQE
jgi:hypothetical protein